MICSCSCAVVRRLGELAFKFAHSLGHAAVLVAHDRQDIFAAGNKIGGGLPFARRAAEFGQGLPAHLAGAGFGRGLCIGRRFKLFFALR